MHVKKVKILKDIKLENFYLIETFFLFTKIRFVINALTWSDFLEIVLSGRIRHFKRIILKGRGFRGGTDEKMRRMWLGREFVVVGLLPLVTPRVVRFFSFICMYKYIHISHTGCFKN